MIYFKQVNKPHKERFGKFNKLLYVVDQSFVLNNFDFVSSMNANKLCMQQ